MFGTTHVLILAVSLLATAHAQRVTTTSTSTGDVYKLKMVSDVCSGLKFVSWRTAPCNVTEGTIPGPYIGTDSDDLYVSWSIRLLDTTGPTVSIANSIDQKGGVGTGVCRGFLTPQYPTVCEGDIPDTDPLVTIPTRFQKAITLQSFSPGASAYAWIMQASETERKNTFYIYARDRLLPLCTKTDNYRYLSAIDPCADPTRRQMELRKEIVPPSGLIGTRSEFELILVTKAPESDTAPGVTFLTPGAPVTRRRGLLAPASLVIRIAQPLVGDFCSTYALTLKKNGVLVGRGTAIFPAGPGGKVTEYSVDEVECGAQYDVEVTGTKPIGWVTPLATASITVC